MTDITLTSEITVEEIQHCGSDDMIAHAAMVSTKGNMPLMGEGGHPTGDKVRGLIKFLMEKRHGTPFEHGALTVRVHAPIKVWREWQRHRVGWCLSGGTPVDFVVPSTGERKQRSIADLFRRFHTPNQRPRVVRMPLRCVSIADRGIGLTLVRDVVESGVKRLYLVRAGGREIQSSEDHLFLTRDGWKRLGELSGSSVLLGIARHGDRGQRAEVDEPTFPEEWRTILWADGFEVSNHGRVRSYFGQGAKQKRINPVLKTVTVNASGRGVVGINGKPAQVSHLVASAFLGPLHNGDQVLHGDDNPLNNAVTNLRIGTALDNMADQVANGGRACNRVVEFPIQDIRSYGWGPTYDISVGHPDHNFVANGFVVHNSYNEESGRYKQLDPVFYVPPRDRPMIRPEGFKSARPAFDTATDLEYAAAYKLLADGYRHAYGIYEQLLYHNIDRGLARDVLGVGIYSACYCTANPRSIMHFLELRTADPTARRPSAPLYEIEVAARKLETVFASIWPATHAAWVQNGRQAP